MAIKSYKKEIALFEVAAQEAGYKYYRGMHPAEELKLLTEAFKEIRELRRALKIATAPKLDEKAKLYEGHKKRAPR